ncbi:hypothetical protein ACTJJ7_00085 [Phyllobacterium sp. 22229]|uniref:hypothetical protein n=1 Tax=Phyllobacterium sp. 22229 TaxID=3453895 RepID=UPI003F86411F
MTSISSATNVASLILQQSADLLSSQESRRSRADNLVAIANGVAGDEASSANPLTGQARSKVFESMFGANSRPSINQIKIELFERTGEALNVDESKYATKTDYFKAVKIAFLALKLHQGGEKIIDGLEEGLGLKDLGLSLETVINAMGNPDGEDDRKVTEALEKKFGAENNAYSGKRAGPVHINDAGIYGISLP